MSGTRATEPIIRPVSAPVEAAAGHRCSDPVGAGRLWRDRQPVVYRSVGDGHEGQAARADHRRPLQTTVTAWLAAWTYLADMLIVVVVLFAAVSVLNSPDLPAGWSAFLAGHVSVKNALFVALFVTWMSASLTLTGAYDPQRVNTSRDFLVNTVGGCALGSVPALLLPVVSNSHLSPAAVLMVWAGSTAGVVAVRAAARLTAPLRRRTRRVVIAGTGPRAQALWARLRHDPTTAYELVAMADVPYALASNLGTQTPGVVIGQLADFLMHTVIDEVFVALPVRSCYEEIEAVLQTCEHAGIHAQFLAEPCTPGIARARPGAAAGVQTVAMHVVHDDWRLGVKRVFDVAASAAGLLALIPVLLGIAAAIKITSRGPIFFGQERFGYRKRRFRMWKFRTMVPDAERRLAEVEQFNEASGAAFKIRNDPRITPLGRLLRRTSLDELPQLWNVLVGDMSIVGPRPMSVRDVQRFDEAGLMRRFSVRPGLTCLWQVSGRSNLTFEQWMELDRQYIDHWSLSLDTRILARTLPAVLRGEGAA